MHYNIVHFVGVVLCNYNCWHCW